MPPDIYDESVKDVITELDLRDLPSGATLVVNQNAIITPSALDTIRSRRSPSSIETAKNERAISRSLLWVLTMADSR